MLAIVVTPHAIANTHIRNPCRIAFSSYFDTSLRGPPPHHKAFVTGFAKIKPGKSKKERTA